MKGKNSIIWGIVFILIQIIVLIQYKRTDCISMPRVHKLCGEEASGAFIAVFMFIAIGIYLILSGIKDLKNKK